jgi:glycosyltransferase involved in cell wall biosynthesis
MNLKRMVSVSVIVPVYNQELYISRCLRSLLDQSLDREKFEIIVVNDASNDNTQKILKSFNKEIVIINNKKNLGLPYSLNQGIKASKGRFVVRVDSDDYVNKDFLNYLQMFLLYNNEMDAVCSDYYLVDDRENIIKRMNSLKQPIGCAIMFRIENLIKIGMYDDTFRVQEDKDLRIRFLKEFKIDRIPLPLYRYRKHSNNITNNKKNMDKHYKRLLKKHRNF